MSNYRAIVTALLMGLAASIAVDVYYERQGAEWLAEFTATGKIVESRFRAYGYGFAIMRFEGGFVDSEEVDDGTPDMHFVPIIFSEPFWHRLLVRWNYQTVVMLSVMVTAFIVSLIGILKTPFGTHIALTEAWLEVFFGLVILAGGFAFKEYLGLDGLDAHFVKHGWTGTVVVERGTQASNIVLGILMIVLALTTRATAVTRQLQPAPNAP